jgi:cobalt/nickel transport system permease protein
METVVSSALAEGWGVTSSPMHAPDGFLSLTVALVLWLVSVVMIVLAVRKTRLQLGERQIPLMGVMAAFIFAAQMINFPVAGGTSGHMLGGALAAMTLGPWAGMLVMTVVIGVQALLFQDGGLVVMGANIFNMGLLTAVVGSLYFVVAENQNRGVRLLVAGVLAWLSVMAGALATSFELWLSGTSPLQVVVPAMLGVHALIGLGEALVTVAALAFITQVRPDLLKTKAAHGGGRGWIVAGMIVALLVVVLSPLASAFPDGLERVAIDMGFDPLAAAAPYELLPDYTIPFLGETTISGIAAGAIGVLIVAGLAVVIGRVVRRRSAASA